MLWLDLKLNLGIILIERFSLKKMGRQAPKRILHHLQNAKVHEGSFLRYPH